MKILKNEYIRQSFITGLIVFALYLGITHAFHPFIVSGNSMQPTYHSGQIVTTITTYTQSDIKAGSVVIFKNNGKKLIKRVVGVPGDTLVIIDGALYINGKKDDLEFAAIDVAGTLSKELTLKNNEYFVMGDNREADNSRDSRTFGAVSYEQIIGIVDKTIGER